MIYHPRLNEQGQKHPIHKPHMPSALESWSDASSIATATPDCSMPSVINGKDLTSGVMPETREQWEEWAASGDFEEPGFVLTTGKKEAAGAVVIEDDGRVWVVSPSNEFGGYANTFPKGRTKGVLSLRATALKEVFEEAGLMIELTGFLVDADRTTTRTRYYLARRIGGNPAEMCWESQAVHLVPSRQLESFVASESDAPVIAALHRHLDAPAAEAKPKAATALDWKTLPFGRDVVGWAINLRLTARQFSNLQLGLVPQAMEQKWFAYFSDNVLHMFRSWTGFHQFRVYFVPQAEGAVATVAEANMDRAFFQGTEEEAKAMLLGVLQYMSDDVTHEPYIDAFVAGLQQALKPNYLGSPSVVAEIVAPLFSACVSNWLRLRGYTKHKATFKDCDAERMRLCAIMNGDDPTYTIMPGWHSAEQLGQALVNYFDLNAEYCADENLYFLLVEGTAAVSLQVRALLNSWCPKDDFPDWSGAARQLKELRSFIESVFLGTNVVLTPGATLKGFCRPPLEGEPEVDEDGDDLCDDDTPDDTDGREEEDEVQQIGRFDALLQELEAIHRAQQDSRR